MGEETVGRWEVRVSGWGCYRASARRQHAEAILTMATLTMATLTMATFTMAILTMAIRTSARRQQHAEASAGHAAAHLSGRKFAWSSAHRRGQACVVRLRKPNCIEIWLVLWLGLWLGLGLGLGIELCRDPTAGPSKCSKYSEYSEYSKCSECSEYSEYSKYSKYSEYSKDGR